MTTSSPQIDYTQEVRFAVVMYGGVSLAIYINGIAQELFRLVRSTAPTKAGGNDAVTLSELTGTERVYRKLAHLLADRPLRLKSRAEIKDNEAKGDKKEPNLKIAEETLNDTWPVCTRFVVDILSGTSAGGINAIYLAKALANDQRIDQLKQLWVNEGDIELLINDKRSVAGLGLKNQDPPQSLLNSRRMYSKLLNSLDDMERVKASEAGFQSPYVDELDLFITTTDIEGLPLPIRLSDSVVYERRHRNVFHMKYASKEAADEYRNDFLAHNNPFLAFSARCTSSFPFAFEPMRLCDMDEVLNTLPNYGGNAEARGDSNLWRSFFNANTLRATNNLTQRAFGDGGYLDNKPFTYATETIARRQATIPVDRKLIYIEPSPEHPEDDLRGSSTPDALQNVKAALLDLPSYETIREDLERLIERNNLINRVNEITDAIEKDLDHSGLPRPSLAPDEWETFDLVDMVQRFGIYYLPYRRLRIEAASDELAKTVAKIGGLDVDSAEFVAIRSLVFAWRELTYPDRYVPKSSDRIEQLTNQIARITKSNDNPEQVLEIRSLMQTWTQLYCPNFKAVPGPAPVTGDLGMAKPEPPAAPAPTPNKFLSDYDFKYWMRRLSFTREKIDQLLQLLKMPPVSQADNFGIAENLLTDKQREIVARLRGSRVNVDFATLTEAQKVEIKELLSFLKCELNVVQKNLRAAGRSLYSGEEGSKENEFVKKIRGINFGPDLIHYILGIVSAEGVEQEFNRLRDDECIYRASRLFDEPSPVAAQFNVPTIRKDLGDAALLLKDILAKTLKPTWLRSRELLNPQIDLPDGKGSCAKPAQPSQYAKGVRAYLWHYFNKFDDYDQIRFPIFYGSDVGESDVVEVFRISPEDAPSLINEREESKKANGRYKLAGTSLHHFGAFLDRVWRQNDIMWGRLDGAERLITALLPNPSDAGVRKNLIEEAHLAILQEELPAESYKQLAGLMTEALVRASSGEPIEESIYRVTQELTDSGPIKTRLNQVMEASLKPDELLKFMRIGYQVNPRLDPKSLLQSLSRSTQIIGSIFEDLANRNSLDGRSLSWIARLGQLFWGLVQVAIPNTILNRLITHWLYVLYAFEFFTIFAGFFLVRSEAQIFGWTALGITAFLNVLTLVLRDIMRGKKAVGRTVIVLLIALLLALDVIGTLKILGSGFGLTVGTDHLPPLAWLASLGSWAIAKVGLSPKSPTLLLMLAVLLIIVILNLVAIVNFNWLTGFLARFRRQELKFKPISLKRFKKRDMKGVQVCTGASAGSYIIPIRLSAEPPLSWIRGFVDEWKTQRPDVEARIFQDRLRVICDLQSIDGVWSDLKKVISTINDRYANSLKVQNDRLQELLTLEAGQRKEELKKKWKLLDKLHP